MPNNHNRPPRRTSATPERRGRCRGSSCRPQRQGATKNDVVLRDGVVKTDSTESETTYDVTPTHPNKVLNGACTTNKPVISTLGGEDQGPGN
ncbi:hypothetical protein NDU88_000214 [Pleurodeles waltl]|uniref:Uncharacterized protein n=1 Tax=Pleurodeles waltl TaxID=8319 RepID=A0AAV7S801_PLEWA|nr:hypothetical protein NDU88_000214 [Pleurodeles waltl]